MSKPLLSVCIITYNQAAYIQEAIDSILAQKLSVTWELIIADDFSTDGTREILLDYKKKHPELIHLILQKSNVGPEKNWLDLMDYPKSTYVLYAEGDDYFTDPTKLQMQINFLETHADFAMCFHPVKVTYEDRSLPDEIFPTPKQRFNKKVLGVEDLLASNFIQTNSVMYRWSFTQKSIKDTFPKNVTPGDWYLHLLHARHGKIGFMDKVMAVYRRHPGGIWWEAANDIDQIWLKYGPRHLNLFVAMKELYPDARYQAVIDDHIFQIIASIIRTDEQYDQHNFMHVIKTQPLATSLYVTHITKEHQKAIHDLTKHSDTQAEMIEYYVTKLQEVEALNTHLLEEQRKPLHQKLVRKLKQKIKP